MKKRKVAKRTAAAGRQPTVKRWTVERLDRDSGMARIEAVPMHPEHVTGLRLTELDTKGLRKDMDDLSLWDARKAKIEYLTIGSLAKKLGLRTEEEERLSENMVFWLVSPGGTKRPEIVYHATEAAREITKKLYYKVARIEGSQP